MVAGPNGSGKTTLVRSGALTPLTGPLPELLLNPDDIARVLRGEMPDATELEVVRRAQAESDGRVDRAILAHRSFLVETVLSSDKFQHRVVNALAAGFRFGLVFITLRAAALHVARVADRVVEGGHDVPTDRILVRRARAHAAFGWFAARAHRGLLLDNTGGVGPDAGPILVAEKRDGQPAWQIYRPDLYPDLTPSL
ncbi:MAG TPA: AAA family ATPase [Acetobacteraceae bacterium]|nr:AAA family ATPase [Acetobacteraceae bacterium]